MHTTQGREILLFSFWNLLSLTQLESSQFGIFSVWKIRVIKLCRKDDYLPSVYLYTLYCCFYAIFDIFSHKCLS